VGDHEHDTLARPFPIVGLDGKIKVLAPAS